MIDTISTVAGFVVDLGWEAGKDYFKEKLDEQKLKSALTNYVERQKNFNEVCLIAEEIDFQGLIAYITENLLDSVSTRLFHPNKRIRGKARDNIVTAAVVHSRAEKDQAKHRVSKCMFACLDMIHDFYASHIAIKDYILAAEIADTIIENTKEIVQISTESVMDEIKFSKEAVLTKITEAGSLFSIDKAVELVEKGEISTIGDGVRKLLNHISLEHPYYPDFGYDYVDGGLQSKPLTEEAKKLFPPRFVLTGAVRFGDQYYNNPQGNPLDYAYRHQIPLTMEVSKAVKYLGDRLDPHQNEVKAMVGSTVLATPPEFPPAFPCALKVGTQTYYDYVLLRTQEILDDGTYVIGNREQNISLYVEIKINPKRQTKPDFRINIDHANNHELLDYGRFMNALSKEKNLHIYILSAGEDLIAGYINDDTNYKSGFLSIHEEIDFLERVCDIEDYFDVKLAPHGVISDQEYRCVLYISDLIRKNEVSGAWSEVTCTGILDQHFREELMQMNKAPQMLSYVGVREVELFGASFEYRFMQSFKCAYMVDLEKVKKKAEILDDGDSIKITYRAGEDKTVIDTLKIPEKIGTASE